MSHYLLKKCKNNVEKEKNCALPKEILDTMGEKGKIVHCTGIDLGDLSSMHLITDRLAQALMMRW